MLFDGVLNIKDKYLVGGTLTVYLEEDLIQLHILPINDIYWMQVKAT